MGSSYYKTKKMQSNFLAGGGGFSQKVQKKFKKWVYITEEKRRVLG